MALTKEKWHARTYDGWLVILSVVVAVVASYVSFDIVSRVAESRRRTAWVGGAVALGAGIGSMHYIGMPAYRFAILTAYNLPLTLLSMLVAVVASGMIQQQSDINFSIQS